MAPSKADASVEQSNKTKYERVRDRDQTEAQQDVRRREADAVRERRNVMFDDRGGDNSDGTIHDAAGMAFSGGGVRSASFNLGLLQAFTQSGVMRWIDYLSTVSGGGFIGTYFSTLLCHSQTTKLNRDLPFVPKKGGGAPVPVDHFIRGGSYLKDSAMMLDRFVIGFALNVILWGSLLVFVTSSLAFAWRTLDSPALNVFVRDHLPGGYFADWNRPFLLTFLLLIGWLGTWIWTYFKGFGPRYDAPRQFQKKLLVVALLSFVVGVASLLATEDISLGDSHYQGQQIVATLLLCALLLNILPYLNPIAIFRSEMRPPGKMQNSILKFSGGALLLLLPFSLVYLFSLEGISGYHTERDSSFVAVDIRRPFGFLHHLRKQALAADEDALTIGAPELARFVYTDSLANGPSDQPHASLPADKISAPAHTAAPADAPSTERHMRLLEHKIHENDEGARDSLLRGYRQILNSVDDRTLLESLAESDGYGRLPELLKEREALQEILEKTGAMSREARAKEIENALDLLKRQTLADLDVLVGDPELDSFIEFGMALEGTATVPHSTVNFARKVTGAYIAAVLNAKFLPRDDVIKVLIDKTQSEESHSGETASYSPADSFFQRARRLREGKEFVDKLWPNAVVSHGVLVPSDRRKINRWIMETLYGSYYVEERTKAGLSLCWSDDQWRRFYFAATSLAVFLLFGLTVDVNATSLHGFYRKKLEDAYVVRGTDGEMLCDLNTTEKGGPYHFICTTLNLFDDWPWKTTEYSSAYTFYFSRLYCGSQALPGDPAETNKYCGGNLDVATVAAISGAAFSPAILKNPLLFCMTMLLNLRLGQWLPNPSKKIATQSSRRVTMISILRDFFRTLFAEKEEKQPGNWDYCFLSDGGHNDNLALAPLLFRQPRLVFVSDATQDGDYNFPDFFKAHRRYRVRGGMNFRKLNCWDDLRDDATCIDLSPLKSRQITCYEETVRTTGEGRSPSGRKSNRNLRAESQLPGCSPQHFVLSKFTYPGPEGKRPDPTILVYIKSTMTGDEPQDLRQYQVNHPEFPHDPTTDQFFTENQVESYRQLGEHIGKEVCDTVERGRLLLGLEREADALWADDCSHQVEDITWMLLLGYFDGELPVSDPSALLELLRRCLCVELMVRLIIALAPHNLNEQRANGLEQIIQGKVAVLKDEQIQELLRRLGTEAKQAAGYLGLGDPTAAKQLAMFERLLLELKKALTVRQKSVGGHEILAMSSDAAHAVESIYCDAVSETCGHLGELPKEVLDFLLRVIKKAQGRVCLDAFAKLVWSRLDSRRADEFVSAMCHRLSKLPTPDDAKRALEYLQKAAIREGMDRPAKEDCKSNAREWRLFDYTLHRIAEDNSFPAGVNEYARQLLQDELKHAQQVVDGVESMETDDDLQQTIAEFFNMLAGDIERPQESVIIYSLGVAERRLSKLIGSSVKVAFVWRGAEGQEGSVSDTESLRYTFLRPYGVVTTNKSTLARKVFQQALPDYGYVSDVSKSGDLKEPRATKGMVAAIPCFVDNEQETPEGVLNVSSGNAVDKSQLGKLKAELGRLARLCAYASYIGKRREATASSSSST